MTKPVKAYELSFDERPGYLYAHLKGETISADVIRNYVREIVAKSTETGQPRIMLYRDIPAVLSEAEVFHTVRESLDALRGKKLALVNPHAAIQKALEFGMVVGHNRGGNYASFEDVETAERWLLADRDG